MRLKITPRPPNESADNQAVIQQVGRADEREISLRQMRVYQGSNRTAVNQQVTHQHIRIEHSAKQFRQHARPRRCRRSAPPARFLHPCG